MKRLLFLLACCASFACAQSATTWEVGPLPVPTSPTNICSDTAPQAPPCGFSGGTDTLHLAQGSFANTNSSGSVTVTITDNSTNCNGGACTLWVAAIAAQSTYYVPFNGLRAYRGVSWSATGTGVHAWLKGN